MFEKYVFADHTVTLPYTKLQLHIIFLGCGDHKFKPSHTVKYSYQLIDLVQNYAVSNNIERPRYIKIVF